MNSDVQPNILKPRWSKVFSDLWDDKTRSSLIVASIAAGVFAVGMIITAFVILSEDINTNYSAANPVNIEIWAGPFYEDLVRVIEKVPSVDDVEGRQVVPIRARRGDENWQSLSLVGIKNFDDLVINQLTTIEGNQFPRKNEVIVSKDVINETGFLVGDEIEIELPDGSIQYLYVAGLVYDQTTAKYDSNIAVNAFATQNTLRSLGLGSYFNRLLVTVEGDGSDAKFISAVAAAIED